MCTKKLLSISLTATFFALTAGCSPNFNWREVQGADPSYTVLFPAKPSSHSRNVDLNGLTVSMSMTAAETEDINFAVASAEIEDEAQRNTALLAMQQAMLHNIRGEIVQQKLITQKDGTTMTEIQATGVVANGRRINLYARFAIIKAHVVQVVALGPQEKLNTEIADTFLSSFIAR
jgi:hypothetical protein